MKGAPKVTTTEEGAESWVGGLIEDPPGQGSIQKGMMLLGMKGMMLVRMMVDLLGVKEMIVGKNDGGSS